MKKHTLQKWIRQQKQAVPHEHNEALRTACMAVLEQCETWLYTLTWATMRAPTRHHCEALRQEGQALIQKGAQRSETETARLAVVQASHAIYTLFLHKITPTALQAEIEQSERQRERARRQEASHSPHRSQSQKTGRND